MFSGVLGYQRSAFGTTRGFLLRAKSANGSEAQNLIPEDVQYQVSVPRPGELLQCSVRRCSWLTLGGSTVDTHIHTECALFKAKFFPTEAIEVLSDYQTPAVV